ncbi:hypothetical protein AGMMS49938_10640 [Fibrobacterales bacterium]|nr:hypothetical protein AGMMS49938_10640 [Fibrobacterales bacterium]
MIMPCVSVIIPIYNVERFLPAALDSLLAQTFTNWEAILVDDCSLDKSGKIADEYAVKDVRFKVIHKTENEGLLQARKSGLKNALGKYIANLDSDDTYHSQFLEKMFEVANRGNYDFVWCGYKTVDLNGNVLKEWLPQEYEWSAKREKNVLAFLNNKFFVTVWNKLVKREIYLQVEFPIKITSCEDILQGIQNSFYANSGMFVQDALYFYTENPKSNTRDGDKNIKKRLEANLVYIKTYEIMQEKLKKENDSDIIFCWFCHILFRCKLQYIVAVGELKKQLKKTKVLECHTETHRYAKIHIRFLFFIALKGFELPAKIYFSLAIALFLIKRKVSGLDYQMIDENLNFLKKSYFELLKL